MTRVLIVDDSVVFRSQIKAALEKSSEVEVVGAANNGKIALQKLGQESIDLITLDMEMPEMNGIETIKEIKKQKFPVKIIVFSSHTTRGSEATLEALSLGADDFVTKPSGSTASITSAADVIAKELLPKVLQFTQKKVVTTTSAPQAVPAVHKPLLKYPKKDLQTFIPAALVIGSSTGGPPTLEKVFERIRSPIRCPIFIAQHMPPVFTASLAKRIQEITQVPTAEGINGEPIQNNRIYVAPGNYHMTVKKTERELQICLDQNPLRNSVRPAVDTLFESAALCWGPKCMGIVLTGMGEDGMLGARAIKEKSGGLLIQNKESCAVFGMPGAVFAAGLYDDIMDLEGINKLIRKMTC